MGVLKNLLTFIIEGLEKIIGGLKVNKFVNRRIKIAFKPYFFKESINYDLFIYVEFNFINVLLFFFNIH